MGDEDRAVEHTEPTQDVADSWQVDDDAIPDEAHTLRRLTQRGDVVYDDVLECNVISISAYSYRDDGMSVYVSTAMTAEDLTDDELMPHCSFGIARIPMHIIRREGEGKRFTRTDPSTTVAVSESRETRGGVVMSLATDGPADERIRRSHGLVRIGMRPVAKPLWGAFRQKLIQGSEYRAPGTRSWERASGVA